MAVMMATLLPWQLLESILNNLKPLSETNKENLSKVLLCGWRSLEGGLSQSSPHWALPSMHPPFPQAHLLYTLSRELPIFPTPSRACPSLFLAHCGDTVQSPVSGMQSHASDDHQGQSKLPDHPFYRACCLPLSPGHVLLCQPKVAPTGQFYRKERGDFAKAQLPVTTCG